MRISADAAKIKRWREERGWSQEHLAAVAGIGLRTVQRIEKGEKASRESLTALAAAFDVDPIALTVDQEAVAAQATLDRGAEALEAVKLSFYIHAASYVLGMLVFVAISVGDGPGGNAMTVPALWWTVGLAGHGLAVVLVALVGSYQRRMGRAD